jgi:hypothetical protein
LTIRGIISSRRKIIAMMPPLMNISRTPPTLIIIQITFWVWPMMKTSNFKEQNKKNLTPSSTPTLPQSTLQRHRLKKSGSGLLRRSLKIRID